MRAGRQDTPGSHGSGAGNGFAPTLENFYDHWIFLDEHKRHLRARMNGELDGIGLGKPVRQMLKRKNQERVSANQTPHGSFGSAMLAFEPKDHPPWVGTELMRYRKLADVPFAERAGQYPFQNMRKRSKAPITELTLADYRVVDVMYEGGMGLILKAFAPKPKEGEQRVIKVIHPKFIPALETTPRDKAARRSAIDTIPERFRRERVVHAMLTHPNIVKYDSSFDSPCPALVMEYVDGPSLMHVLNHFDGWPLPVPVAAEFIVQFARALAFVHRKGIIHRDLSPQNILMERCKSPTMNPCGWRLALNDFGLSILQVPGDGPERFTDFQNDLDTKGTQHYLSPEHKPFAGIELNAPSDMFVLGIIAYELLTGRHPFVEGSRYLRGPVLSMTRVVEPREKTPNLPRDINDIFMQLFSLDPSKRPSAEDIVSLFSDHAPAMPVCPTADPIWPPAAAPLGKRPDAIPASLFPILAVGNESRTSALLERFQPDKAGVVAEIHDILKNLPIATRDRIRVAVAEGLSQSRRICAHVDGMSKPDSISFRQSLGTEINFKMPLLPQLEPLEQSGGLAKIKHVLAEVQRCTEPDIHRFGTQSDEQLSRIMVDHCTGESLVLTFDRLIGDQAVADDDLEELAKIASMHVTYSIEVSPEELSTLSDPSAPRLFRGRATNLTIGEALAARLSGAPARYRTNSMSSPESMAGEHAFYCCGNPEIGPAGTGDDTAQLNLGALAFIHNLDSWLGKPRSEREPITESEILQSKSRAQASQTVRKDLDNALARIHGGIEQDFRKFGRRTYCLIKLPPHPAELENVLKILSIINSVVENLLFIELIDTPNHDPHYLLARALNHFLRDIRRRRVN
jgi:serine/threonine protein kinase